MNIVWCVCSSVVCSVEKYVLLLISIVKWFVLWIVL